MLTLIKRLLGMSNPPSADVSRSARIYEHARKDLGLREIPGDKSDTRIQHAIRTAATWLDRDDSKTAWCGCIRGLWGLETGTGVPKEHFRAAEWLKWGEPVRLNDPYSWRQGDTAILRRTGGSHVAIVDHVDIPTGRVYLLGGNQSNACNVSPFAIKDVIGVRR
jgi:uncharacterized protein (TIGR02594 family)